MSEDLTTRPTIETVLERVNAIGEQVNTLGGKFDTLSEKVDIRLDRIEGLAYKTHAEMLTLRADFKELNAHIRQTT